jgi:hypothetical protein
LVYNRGLFLLINFQLQAEAEIFDEETGRRLIEAADFYQTHIAYLDYRNAVYTDPAPFKFKRAGDPPLPLAEAQYLVGVLAADPARRADLTESFPCRK